MNEFSDFKKVLVFSPHPDDLDFACSGTVAKMTKRGIEVVYCIITNGEKGIHKVKLSSKEMISMRKMEQRKAAKVAGVQRVIFLSEIDGELENTKKLRKKIVKVIRGTKPDVVFSLDPSNRTFDSFYRFHRDHRMAAEAVFDAVYPAAGSSAFFPELERAGILPHQVRRMWFFGTETPNVFVDISIDDKVEALKQHVGQIEDMKALSRRIRDRARTIGKKKKMKYAESFRELTF